MKQFLAHITNKRDRILAGAAGGITGAAAYALAQKADLKAFGHNTDDFVLLGRMVTSDDERIRPVGTIMHFANGAALGAAYGLVGRDLMPGPPLAKGLSFTILETFGLYPLAVFQRFHPGIREGRLDSYLTPVALAQQVVRHVAYGVALGPITELLLKKT